VNSSPARFDMKKLEAINGDKIRELTVDDFLKRALPFLIKDGVIKGDAKEVEIVKAALPIIQERIVTLSEIPAMLKFLFVTNFEVDAESLPKIADENAQLILKRALADLSNVNDWSHAGIEAVLRASLIEELGLKPRIAFTALRIATTGSTISPPLFESMELLGKVQVLARIKGCLLG
ncbi:MAG: glutamate--tRNA ligase, partial [Actinobacteria bacterium]|nr:glutamate--tRNA ligase [Actinomycetota bacterium]